VNAEILRAVFVTTLLCVATGLVLLHRQERRHDRETQRQDEAWRQAMWEQRTGISPGEQAEFDAIVARWDDAGLTIFDGEGEPT
jgi:hypothetical protein